MQQTSLPRGLRNNNPCNIRKTNTPWLGKLVPGSDPDFEQFKSLEFGYRAAIVNVRTMIRRDRIDRVGRIIERWAPTTDGNDTAAYIKYVCNRACFGASDVIKYNDRNKICRLVWAMSEIECGQSMSFGRVENAWAII